MDIEVLSNQCMYSCNNPGASCMLELERMISALASLVHERLAEVLTVLESKGDDAGLYILHRYATSTKVSLFQPK